MSKVINTKSMTTGVLVVTGVSWHAGKTVTIYRLVNNGQKAEVIETEVAEFRDGDTASVYAAVFLGLPAGTYQVCYPGNPERSNHKHVTIIPAGVVEVVYPY